MTRTYQPTYVLHSPPDAAVGGATEELDPTLAVAEGEAAAPPAEANAPTTTRGAIREAFEEAKAAKAAEKPLATDKPRTDDGKFKPGDKTQAPRAAVDPKQALAAPATQSLVPSATPPADKAAPQPIVAPQSWGAGDKAAFAKLPPDMQAVIARRDSEREKALSTAQQESADIKKRYGDLDQTFQANNQRLTLRGETPVACAKRLMQMDEIFDKEPLKVIQHLMQLRGITPQHLMPGTQNQGPRREDMDPVILQLQDQVGRMTQNEQQRVAAAKQAVDRQSSDTISAFKAETNEQGQPKYPYTDKLEHEIAFEINRLIEADKRAGKQLKPMADYLKSGYEAAVWADPTLREEQLQARVATATADKVREQAENAKRVQQAGRASVRGGSGAPTPGPATVRGAIKEAFQAASGL